MESCTVAILTFLMWASMAQDVKSFTQNEDEEYEVPSETSEAGQRQGLQYIGVGYDIIKGNPQGAPYLANVDPGLLVTKNILKLFHNNTPAANDRKGLSIGDGMNDVSTVDILSDQVLQEQIAFVPRRSCRIQERTSIVKDTKDYQDLLSVDVGVSACSSVPLLLKFKFGASEGFKKTDNVTKTQNLITLMETELCNMGRVRYKYKLAEAKRWPVTEEFAASVCDLPAKDDGSQNEKRAYMNFIEEWGTHVVIQTDFGVKNTTKYLNTIDTFLRLAEIFSNTSVHVGLTGGEGAPITLPATASVNVDVLSKNIKHISQFKNSTSKEHIYQGTEEMPKPIAIKVKSIIEALKPRYWQTLEDFISSRVCKKGQAEDEVLKKKRTILQKHLKNYPEYIGAQLPSDLPITMAITWPEGKYALPETNSGCPEADGKNEWNKGWRFQDTADVHAAMRTAKKPKYIRIKYDKKDNVKSYFCIKAKDQWKPVNTSRVFDRPWSPGKYCIYKFEVCPEGFVERFIHWKDQRGWTWRGNDVEGSRPAGHYDKKTTTIFFCCRNDGPAEVALLLPSEKPLALFPVESGNCQKVHGMNFKEEVASWDTHRGTTMSKDAPVPVSKVTHSRVKLHYCYYYKA